MNNDLIFDLGMNNGDDTDFYLKKGFRVVAVEASPDLCARARERFAAELASGRLQILHKAISDREGEIELFIDEDVSGWATVNLDWRKARDLVGTSSRSVTVPAVTLQNVLREYGVPYYLKADIQGNELLCLEALTEFTTRPKFVSISTGCEIAGPKGMQPVRHAVALFSQLGYRRFKIVPQDRTKFQKCPSPALEGSYVDYAFQHGSSGLFGAELPGDWIDARDALQEYWKIIWSYKFSGDSRIAYGWLTRLPSYRLKSYFSRLFWRGTTWYDTHAMHEGS